MTYAEVQQIAKQSMDFIKNQIKVGMNLGEIREMLERKMLSLGATSFWYWDVGAFIFSGNETKKSISGKHYKTPKKLIENNDIITIDLSPQVDNIWGDYARTIIIENGLINENKESIINNEWKSGLIMEDVLHSELLSFATPETTFEELYFYINDIIKMNNYINLDFNRNLGHSIEKNKRDRIYIKKGNKTKLGDIEYFTFEPHISTKYSKYGFKKENIYFFESNKLKEL